MTDPTQNQNGPALTPEQMEQNVRTRMAEIDQEIASAREQKKAVTARIKDLNAEKERWQRMLPRAPRRRNKASGEQLTLP